MPTYYDEKTKTWYCKFNYKDYAGTIKQKKKRGFKLQREAKEWERDFLDKQAGSPDMPFSAMCDLYLADKKAHTKEITYRTKEGRVRKWIRPYFKDKGINDITAADVRKWQADLKEEIGENGKPLSPGYLQNIVTELSGIFNFAVRYYGLPVNPCQIAGNTVGKKTKSLNFWTKEQFDKFINTFEKGDKFYAAFMTLYYTGMRIGELQALTFTDIDLDKNVIHITKTRIVINGKEMITPPKTKNSVRDVLIPQFLSDVLKEYKGHFYKPHPQTRVFNMSRQPYRIRLKEHAELAGVNPIRLHDLRHSHASLLIELGFSALLVSERLGHENVSTTLDIYSHLFPSKQSEVVEKLDKLFLEK